jgi:hypothetical protein
VRQPIGISDEQLACEIFGLVNRGQANHLLLTLCIGWSQNGMFFEHLSSQMEPWLGQNSLLFYGRRGIVEMNGEFSPY